MAKIGFITNVSTDVLMLERARKYVQGINLMVYDLKGNFKKFREFCKGADIVVARLMGGKDVFPVEEFHKFLVENGVHFCPFPTLYENHQELEPYCTVSAEDRRKILKYMAFEGIENYRNLLLFLASKFGGEDVVYEEPKSIPWQGIYYRGRIYGREYLEKLNPEKPTVGILFYRNWWVSGDIKHIDALISEIEKHANVVAVFCDRGSNDLGSWGMERSVQEYFTRDGNPVIDVLVNVTMFSLTSGHFGLEKLNFLERLDVPLLQAIVGLVKLEEWENSEQGLSPVDVVISAAMPEFDSAIIHFPIACKKSTGGSDAEIVYIEPVPDRVEKFARIAVKYATLKRKENAKKRIAIVLHNYPPRNDRVASAFGLDSPESVARLLKKLRDEGFYIEWVPKNGNELIEKVLTVATNDQRHLTTDVARIMKKNVNLDLPDGAKEKMVEHWGNEPGKAYVFQGEYLLPIVINGNVLIGLQPARGFGENPEKAYHNPDLPPTYQYIAFYHYISKIFKADAIIHVGKHGTLEWLPGKGFGLSHNCFPDVCMDVPHFYIYIVNNPGEGTQAKRRGYACIIDHLPPAFTTADLYEDYLRLEKLLEDYYGATGYGKGQEYRESVLKLAKELKLVEDTCDNVEEIHEALLELKTSMINLGLHVFGQGLEGEKLVETIVSILRIRHGNHPSILEIASRRLGYNLELNNEECLKRYGKTKSKIMEEIFGESRRIVREVIEKGAGNELSEFILDLKRKLESNEEIDWLVKSINGRYVKPGMSGAITRNPKALPTGKNFYSCNPWEIPTEQAYENGKKLAEELVRRYLEEEGKYPETVAMVIWSSPTMRTQGEDVAQFLYLLGVKPKYDRVGRVNGLEAIPLGELGRPRIDVVVRISGMFRDSFYNLVELMDNAVRLVATLDEPDDLNYVKKHVKEGIDLLRIFGDMPGAHGAGVSHLLENGNWEDVNDLAKAYIKWGCYAYGKDRYGVEAEDSFLSILKIVEVTVKNEDSQEWDIFEGDDFNNYHGGLIATIRSLGGDPKSYVGDSSNPESIKVRSLEEEGKRIYRSKVMNPKWIEEMKKHGYKGGEYFSKYVDHMFQWDATSDIIEDWMYDGITEKYVFSKEMREFFKENNPYALLDITERLLEAIQRGMWNADDETKERLRQIYLEMEAGLE